MARKKKYSSILTLVKRKIGIPEMKTLQSKLQKSTPIKGTLKRKMSFSSSEPIKMKLLTVMIAIVATTLASQEAINPFESFYR